MSGSRHRLCVHQLRIDWNGEKSLPSVDSAADGPLLRRDVKDNCPQPLPESVDAHIEVVVDCERPAAASPLLLSGRVESRVTARLPVPKPLPAAITEAHFGVDDQGHPRIFNALLTKENLKLDRDGNRRAPYSLRHTYICLRLLGGADIYQLAKNCRTSVEMIEKHYAVHLKNTLDAAAINVRKPKNSGNKAKEK
jgi:hypothetical protein